MHTIDEIRRQFRYNQWANEQSFASLPLTSPISPRMAHLIGAEWLWLSRLASRASSVGVWPALAHEEAKHHLVELDRAWGTYLGALAPIGLDREISYVNSLGEPWSSRVQDVLAHVVMHAAYHRGQIASEVRGAGGTPAYTDFIHYTRSVARKDPGS